MDNTNTQGYQPLGKKVFWLFLLQISPASVVMFLLFIILSAISSQSLFANTAYLNMQQLISVAASISFFLFLIVAVISFIYTWLVYINYKFCMAEDSFKIKRGILNKTEAAIPYRQIQDVDVERDVLFLIFGLSRIVILTAGQETDKEDVESKGVIPAVDKALGEWLQTELLRRADIQKTIAVSK